MSMSGEIVRANPSHIHDKQGFANLATAVAALLQRHNAVAADRQARQRKPARVSIQICRCWSNSKRGIVEQCDLPVRMAHGSQPAQHPVCDVSNPFRQPLPPVSQRLGTGREEIEQVQQVLQNDGVVHRAQLEMPAIRENLLI